MDKAGTPADAVCYQVGQSAGFDEAPRVHW